MVSLLNISAPVSQDHSGLASSTGNEGHGDQNCGQGGGCNGCNGGQGRVALFNAEKDKLYCTYYGGDRHTVP